MSWINHLSGRTHRSTAALLAVGSLAACADGDAVDRHLDIAAGPATAAEEASAEVEWLRSLQMIRQTVVDQSGNVQSQTEVNDASLYTPVFDYCSTALNYANLTGCEFILGRDLVLSCVGRTYLAISRAQAEAVSLPQANGSTIRYDRVSEESAAALAFTGAHYAGDAARDMTSLLSGTGHPSCRNASGVWSTDAAGQPIAPRIAAGIGEAYQLGLQAYDRAIEATLNASDKLRSTSVSPSLAAQRAISGAELSRAAAAHLLVGGKPGILGSTLAPLCTSPDLNPQAKAALGLLRDSGVSPALLQSPSITTLLDTATADGSVRQRLAQFHGISSLASGGSVAAHYDLSDGDFDTARKYLLEEIKAFSRSTTAQLPPTSGGAYRRYAGVTREPEPLPPGAWAARASYRTAEPDWGLSSNRMDLRWFIATLHSNVRNILKSTETFASAGGSATAMRAEVFGALGPIVSSNEYRGMLRARITSTNTLMAYAYNYAPADRVRVVVGEDGLRCAVTGSIEGASCADVGANIGAARYPCSAADLAAGPTLSCLTAAGLTATETTPNYGTSGATYAWKTVANTWIADKTRLYFVKPKTTADPLQPGYYESLGGMVLHTVNEYSSVPVVPTVDARVDEVFAPSRKFCSVPQTSCVGVTVDARLPLEDELTDNGDGIENSWKHYLDLARQAADEADLYGKEYASNAVSVLAAQAEQEIRKEEQQQQAESMLQELQDICGTAIDSRALLTALSGTVDGDLSQIYVANPAGGACQSGYRAIPSGCIIDFTKIHDKLPDSPDALRLKDCLALNTTPFVTLGSRTLCVYSSLSDPNKVCPPGISCPVVKPKGGSCPAPASGHKLDEAVTLNYFDDKTPTPGPCTTFRRARTNPNKDDVDAIIASNFFIKEKLKEKVQSIQWDAKYGGFSDILVNGVARHSTGHVSSGASTSWPCVPRSDCNQDTADGLFCHPAACANNASRGALNYRMLRATVAANLALGLVPEHGHINATFPDYPIFTQAYTSNGQNKQLITIDPCLAQGLGSVSEPTNAVYVDNNAGFLYRYETSTNENLSLTEGSAIVKIRECRAAWGAEHGYPHPRAAGFASFERLSTTQKPAWISENGTEYQSGNGQRFAFMTGYAGVSPYDADATSRSLLGGLTMEADEGPHWTVPVLRGDQDEDDLGTDGSFDNYHHFTAVYPYDTVRQDYRMDYPGWDLTGSDLLDGVELLCELGSQPPAATANQQALLESIDSAAISLEQLAETITRAGASTVFARVPKIAQDAMRETSVVGGFPALGGRMATEVANLREALISTRHALPIVSGALRQLALEVRTYRVQVEIAVKQDALTDLSSLSQQLSALQTCAGQVASISVTSPLSVFGASMGCAFTGVQLGIAMQSAELQKDINDDQLEIARQGMIERISQLATNLETSSISLRESFERVDRALAAIEGLQNQGQVIISRALHTASYQSQKNLAYVRGLGTIATAYQVRYSRALKNAKLMSFFAKRAIEQRLGVKLSEMVDPLPLVDPPATWEGSVCTSGGMRGEDKKAPGDFTPYVGGFIGDYVTKLQNLVESYRLQYKFHEGEDLAVVSLRDDVIGIKAACDAKGRNLFASAGQIETASWKPVGCRTVQVNGVAHPAYNCMAVVPLGEQALDGRINPINAAPGYRLYAGTGTVDCTTSSCGYQTGAALAQRMTLAPGRYRFSWYTKETNDAGGANDDIVYVGPQPGALPMYYEDFTETTPVVNVPWRRVYAEFTIADNAADGKPGEYDVGFRWFGGLTQTVTIAAPMLERLPSDGSAVILGSFQNTDVDGNIQVNVCEDTDGANFRAKSWRRECVHLCDAGFSNNCSDGPEYCYRELTFGVSQRWLENGKLFSYSGFARGNFNYRIDSLALNFVGSAVRNCEDSDAPSTCYSAGFVPYSVEHNGPFFVRTHDGNDFRAYLFDGRIEHARGLAAERYLTNPLSSTDRELLSDYMRHELRGRPLDGNFTVRVWEEPGVDFEAIQDVQLLLKYKYWTRFE